MNTIGIYFGSQTGTAESFAHELREEAGKHGLQAEVIDLAEVTEASFTKHRYIIMVMATHYEGNPTDNAEYFWYWFSLEDEVAGDWLNGYKYTVFALGDQSYVNFAKIGRETDRLLEKYGARRVFSLGIGNDDEGRISKHFKEWKKPLWDTLTKEFEPSADGQLQPAAAVKIPFSAIISSFATEKPLAEHRKQLKDYNHKTQQFLSYTTMRVSVVSELRQNTSATNFSKYLELTTAEPQPQPYTTACNLGVYPRNSKNRVDRMMALLGFSINYIFTVKANVPNKKLPLPTPLSTDAFLSQHIDLHAKVLKADLIKMKDSLGPEGYAAARRSFEELEARGVFDIVDLFEHAKVKVSLDLLVNLDKRIEPRLYTVCSSSLVSPSVVGIAVSCLQFGERVGLFSSFVHDLSAQLHANPGAAVFVQAKLQPSVLRLPSDPNSSVVLVGNGVGIAPMRGICQEAGHLRVNKLPSPLSNVLVFFGTKTKNDRLFEADFQTAFKLGAIQHFETCYSREEGQPKKYVQEALAEHRDAVLALLSKPAGSMLVCGSSGLRKGVIKALEDALGDAKQVQDWVNSGKLLFECFG